MLFPVFHAIKTLIITNLFSFERSNRKVVNSIHPVIKITTKTDAEFKLNIPSMIVSKKLYDTLRNAFGNMVREGVV